VVLPYECNYTENEKMGEAEIEKLKCLRASGESADFGLD
jgi:hypothetical protein